MHGVARSRSVHGFWVLYSMSCVSFMWRHKKRTFDEDLSKYHRENERRGSGEAAVIYFRGMVKECILGRRFL